MSCNHTGTAEAAVTRGLLYSYGEVQIGKPVASVLARKALDLQLKNFMYKEK